MKKLVYTAFIAFWAAVGTLLLVAWLYEPGPAPDSESEPVAEEPRTISLAEVAGHAAPDDCWMAIDGAVYDLSEYVPRHPTETEVIAEWCGRRAGEAMRTKGGQGREHSNYAWRRLERYRIGTLPDTDT